MKRFSSLSAIVWPVLFGSMLLLTACGDVGEANSQERAIEVDLTDRLAQAHWPAYGGDIGGARYSPLAQINKDNVTQLQVAWTSRTGDMRHDEDGPQQGPCSQCHASDSKFETTPILGNNTLFVSTPTNRVVAFDAQTGVQQWMYDPKIDLDIDRSEDFISRGVSQWMGQEPEAGSLCQHTIFKATIDARLIALDAETGALCPDFGKGGTVGLDEGVGRVQEGQYGVTSPPVVIGDVVVVGSSMGDNRRVDMERGTVRAYHAKTGELLWSWDPIPRNPESLGWDSWTPKAAQITGAANAWAPLSGDAERDLVFLPTGSAAPDFYGGERLGDNLFANSVVALRASTGEYVWHFQVVHHDLWDYDVAAQPSLITVPRDGQEVPAVAVGTKTGLLFVLHRETGEPLFPVEERPVPTSTVEGEEASPTQPYPVLPRPLHQQTIGPDQAWGITEEELAFCRQQMENLTYEGAFTPPSEEGTLFFPGFGGGINWGGMAYDDERNLLVTTVNRLTMWVRLHKRPRGSTAGNQKGTPYTMSRAALVSPSGLPCNAPPWSTMVAVDLESGEVAWEVPLGFVPELAEHPEAKYWGSPFSMGGPIITAGGLVFIGASRDDAIRAFDIETGEELWRAELPAGGQATPMTYEIGGKQYLVIAAGGHASMGTTPGDYVVAFALP